MKSTQLGNCVEAQGTPLDRYFLTPAYLDEGDDGSAMASFPVSLSCPSDQVVTADCENGLNDVVMKPNFLHSLATVVTLGIWMPAAVEFRCRAPHGDGGSFPEAPPNPS